MLRLGTSKAYLRYFVPFLITRFRDAYPHIKIHLHEGSSSDIIHSLIDFQNEVAVIAKVEDNPDICLIPFTHEELALIPAFDHLRARKEALRFKELTKEMIIMHERVSETRRQAERSFAENRCTLKILMQKSHAETVKLLVQHGEVVALLVRKAVIHELQEGKLVTLPSQITRSS